MTRRVLLTGATGLLGGWVVQAWPADGPDLVPVGSRDADLLAPGGPAGLIDRVRPTDVVHLAWAASGTPGYRNSGANAEWLASSIELLHAARRHRARCWFTGTAVDDVPEGSQANVDAYSLSKSRLRRILVPGIDSGDIGWLRPSYVFDEVRGRPALVAASMESVRTLRPVVLRTPAERHDFVHAADVGTAVVVAVTQGLTASLDIGAGRARSVARMVEALGASWTVEEAVPEGAKRHSARTADIGWLIGRGWRPHRTQSLFGDDELRSPDVVTWPWGPDDRR